MWNLVLYTEDGTCPVGEFLTKLDAKTQVRFSWSIQKVAERNIDAKEPLVYYVNEQLRKLQEESNSSRFIYELLYSLCSGRRVVFLHGFRRRSQGETPPQEIEIALQRLKQYEVFIAKEGA